MRIGALDLTLHQRDGLLDDHPLSVRIDVGEPRESAQNQLLQP